MYMHSCTNCSFLSFKEKSLASSELDMSKAALQVCTCKLRDLVKVCCL